MNRTKPVLLAAIVAGLSVTGFSYAAEKGNDRPTPPKIRDWNAIDKNNDNLIEPNEMQGYLDKYGGRQVAEETGKKR